jgi:hypothetical protein
MHIKCFALEMAGLKTNEKPFNEVGEPDLLGKGRIEYLEMLKKGR